MIALFILISHLFISTSLYTHSEPLKVLHLSFHKGCMEDIEQVASELGFDVTSWSIYQLGDKWEGSWAGNDSYNIDADRAQRVWNLHHDFFNQFDMIITSDTAPLSRIFLQ